MIPRLPVLVGCLFAAQVACAAESAVPAAASSPDAAEKTGPTPEELLKLRDPFKRPAISAALSVQKSELERFPVEQFKMVGITTGPDKLRAMIVDPNGKTYFVSERERIGVRSGFIRRISVEGIIVREKITNVLGKEENIDFEMKLPPEKKSAGNTGG